MGIKILQPQKSGRLDMQRLKEKKNRTIFPPERETGFVNKSHVNKDFSN